MESAGRQGGIPHLRKQGAATQLVVDGAPFLILGGELGNSSASSAEALEEIWPQLVSLHANTALVPVSWELIEPEEGRFDFGLVRHAIEGARRHGLRLVLLWFGSWKNSMSCYAPAWVKADQARFPRAERRDGRGLEMLSAFGAANCQADARAFAALMRFVRELDGDQHTVLMVQVENEVGMLEEVVDRGPAAARAFAAPVPAALLAAPGTPVASGRGGSWAEVFGEGARADEIFAAWHYARYVDAVARAGKAEHPLPMFVNAALNRPDRAPGDYPSGGPLPHLFEVWRAGAPAVDLLAPDIYLPDFAAWCAKYAQGGNPLFVPEATNAAHSAVDVLYALGAHQALGFSPFSIESMAAPARAALAASYQLVGALAPLILESQGGGRLAGVLLDDDTPSASVRLGGYRLDARHDYTWEWSGPARSSRPWPRAGALAIALGEGEILFAGNGVIVTFAADGPGEPTVGLASVDEGRSDGGRFLPGRRLNGDETHQGRHLRLPCGAFGLQRARLYRYR